MGGDKLIDSDYHILLCFESTVSQLDLESFNSTWGMLPFSLKLQPWMQREANCICQDIYSLGAVSGYRQYGSC